MITKTLFDGRCYCVAAAAQCTLTIDRCHTAFVPCNQRARKAAASVLRRSGRPATITYTKRATENKIQKTLLGTYSETSMRDGRLSNIIILY